MVMGIGNRYRYNMVYVIDPLKWTKKGPTNDPCMISDEFETFGNNHF